MSIGTKKYHHRNTYRERDEHTEHVEIEQVANTMRDGSERWIERKHPTLTVSSRIHCEFDVEIDMDALIEEVCMLARNNATGKSRRMGGIIKVTRTKREREITGQKDNPIPDGWMVKQGERA